MADPKDDTTDLRSDCPRWIVDVIDAYAIANRKTRKEIHVQLAREWAEHQLHIAKVMHSVAAGNPLLTGDERESGANSNPGAHR
ncbi:MAG: hypothetical protein NUV51_01125 [Sulfuricaulis sp.]|nr:hypothetical protein [Sulfuricaulis sp.]